MSVEDRAIKYLVTLDSAIAGQHGHDRFFHAACVLVVGFNMTVDEARPCLRWYNENKCSPPFSDKDLEHKLESASKKGGPRGLLLGGAQRPRHDRPAPQVAVPLEAAESPALALGEYFESQIDGRHFAASWPWLTLQNLTNALRPSTVTLLAAAEGTSKTLFTLEAARYWVCEKNYSLAMLELEDNRVFHLARVLAQIEGNASITDPAWVRSHPDEARAAWVRHSDVLDAVGRCIWEGPTSINTDSIIMWLESMCAVGKRIIVIDPITARDPSDKPWIDDHRFVARAKDLIKESESSLVLVTHPPKGQSREAWGGDVAGGAAYSRLAQTIIYLRGMPETKSLPVLTMCGRVEAEVNRKVELAKTRNGKGWRATVGMYFDPETLRHVERGIIVK